MNSPKQPEERAKKPYASPQLHVYGDIRKITQVSLTNVGNDSAQKPSKT